MHSYQHQQIALSTASSAVRQQAKKIINGNVGTMEISSISSSLNRDLQQSAAIASVKTSTIKTTPHNLAAIISKIKNNNEVSGGSAVSGGSVNQSIVSLKKNNNLRSKRIERVSLQIQQSCFVQQQVADASTNKQNPTSNMYFSNNAFGNTQPYSQNLTSRPYSGNL